MIDYAKLTFRQVAENDASEIILMAKKCQLTITKGLILFCVSLNNKDVGICGYMQNKDSAKFKFDYVIPEYRQNGILANMIKFRINYAIKNKAKNILVNAMPMAVNSHIKAGARILKKYKYGGMKLIYENIQ